MMTARALGNVSLAAVVCAGLLAQVLPPPAFEVASVKPSSLDSRDSISLFTYPGGRIGVTQFTLRQLIQEAYSLNKYQVSGGPRWIEEDRYDIVAKPPASSEAAKFNPPTPKIRPTQEIRLMMQTLLADRFQLKVHLDSKDGPAYALVVAAKGSKLPETKNHDAYRLDQTAPFNTTESLKNVPVAGLLIVPGSPLPAGTKISPSGAQPDLYTPTVITWSFKIEQQLASNTSLGVGYVGSHGYHELLSADVNEPFPTICPASPCPASLVAGTIYYPTGAPLANPALANTTTWLSEGLSSYNALQIDVNRHFTRGFQIRGVYTWSKSLDDGTALNSSVGANAPGFVMYPNQPKWDWSPSNSDARNIAVINSSYELPIGGKARGITQKLIAGWTVSGVETVSVRLPLHSAVRLQSRQ